MKQVRRKRSRDGGSPEDDRSFAHWWRCGRCLGSRAALERGAQAGGHAAAAARGVTRCLASVGDAPAAALAWPGSSAAGATGDPLKVELDAAVKRVGELSMENELLRKKIGAARPLAFGRSRR